MSKTAEWNASLYDDKHSFVYKMAAGLVDQLEVKPGERILDVGCGTGTLTEKIASLGATVVGTDRSPEMVEQARDKFPSLHFEVMDARELRFAEPFDAVFSNATLHWIKEADRVAAGVAVALKPGGRFVAEFGGKGNIDQVVAAAQHAWRSLGFPGQLPNPWYYPGIAEYSNVLEQAGLEVTFANLFERPTPLEDGERGLHNWLEMFASSIMQQIPADKREALISEIERAARPTLWHDDHWILDYRRLRVIARKKP
jgi:trans-aconitate methyltransferase